MSGAEMTIRLVDGTEAEQAAFNRGPDDHEPNHVPSVGGIDTGSSQRSEAVEAIAAGFATITDKESKDDSQHDTTATVAAIHEQFADIANGTKSDKPTHQQGDPTGTKTEGPTTEDYRGYRVALEQLVQRFTPKFFSEPIDRLIAALNPREAKPENRETQAGPPPIQTTENRAPIIPAVGHVAPKQDEGDASKPTADGKPAGVPTVGHVAPTATAKQADAPRPVSVGDIVSKVQQRIARIPVVGKRLNGAINAVRSTAKKYQGGLTKVAKSITGAIGKTKTGKAFLASGSKLASKVAGSSFGKAVAGAGRSVVGAVARTVGATAAGGALSGGTGAATAVAAGGTTAAAGGGAATVAAGGAAASAAPAVAAAAPLLANPVGLAVGAVVASFAALALASKALNDTFTSEADRLEQFSSAITMAKAKQQISTEMNMLSRSKEVGPGLAKITEAQTRYQDATQELWTSILAILLKTAPVVEVVSDALTALVRGVDLGVASVEQVAAALTPDGGVDDKAAAAHAAAAGAAFGAAVQDIFRNNNANQPGNGPDPFLMSLLKARI